MKIYAQIGTRNYQTFGGLPGVDWVEVQEIPPNLNVICDESGNWVANTDLTTNEEVSVIRQGLYQKYTDSLLKEILVDEMAGRDVTDKKAQLLQRYEEIKAGNPYQGETI